MSKIVGTIAIVITDVRCDFASSIRFYLNSLFLVTSLIVYLLVWLLRWYCVLVVHGLDEHKRGRYRHRLGTSCGTFWALDLAQTGKHLAVPTDQLGGPVVSSVKRDSCGALWCGKFEMSTL